MSKVGEATKEEIIKADKALSKVFYSDDFVMSSLPRFWQTVKDEGIPYRVVHDWYENQQIIQLFKPLKKPSQTFHIKTSAPFKAIYMDTMAIDEYYIINTIDLFSKYGWLTVFRKPVDSNDAVKALKEFLHHAKATLSDIGTVRVDNGSEFAGSFAKYVGDKRQLSLPYAKSEQSPVERFNGTIRRMLEKVRALKGTRLNWVVTYAPKVVTAYNGLVQKSIGFTPNEALHDIVVQNQIMRKLRQQPKPPEDIKKGDTVRVSVRDVTNAFDSKIGQNWSTDTFKVTAVRSNRITLNDGQVLKSYQVRVIDPDKLMNANKVKAVTQEERQTKTRERDTSKELRKLADYTTAVVGKEWVREGKRQPKPKVFGY